MAVAVFNYDSTSAVVGIVEFLPYENIGVLVHANFTLLPEGEHGFHIHKAGDLRGKGCVGACEHFDITGKNPHGGPPGSEGPRHTGDLGNISLGYNDAPFDAKYLLKGIYLEDLYGRSVIVHENIDDLGKGNHPDSKTTGNSGARIACAIIGRMMCSDEMSGGDKGLYSDNPRGRKPRVPGTGYGTRKKALHTIKLLKKKPIGLKRQIATTLYYRAKHHARQTKNMRAAMKVYRSYLKNLKKK